MPSFHVEPSPYLRAHAAYHSGEPPTVPWLTLLDAVLQSGVVISTPRVFLLAGPCRVADPAGHGCLNPLQFTEVADCWHIFLAAGDLSAIRAMTPPEGLAWISYYRRDGRLRIYRHAALARHDQAESLPSPTPAAGGRAAAGDGQRPGN